MLFTSDLSFDCKLSFFFSTQSVISVFSSDPFVDDFSIFSSSYALDLDYSFSNFSKDYNSTNAYGFDFLISSSLEMKKTVFFAFLKTNAQATYRWKEVGTSRV